MNPNIYRKNIISSQQNRYNKANQRSQNNPKSQSYVKQNWIGEEQEKQKNQFIQFNQQSKQHPMNQFDEVNRIRINQYKGTESPLNRLANSLYKIQDSQIRMNKGQSTERSPTQLIQDVFRGIGLDHFPLSKAYYSKQVEQNLSEILSNKIKLQNYIKKLSNSIASCQSPDVAKNYQILLILLVHLSQTQLQIHHNDIKGLQIKFNRTQLQEKQKQIERLQKQLQEKNKQAEKIVQEYEGVIRNFNDVIQKLVNEKRRVQY